VMLIAMTIYITLENNPMNFNLSLCYIMSTEQLLEESDLEVVEDTGAIEKVKKPHKLKGIPASPQMLLNLQKGRDARKLTQMLKVEEKAKAVILKKPELVRQVVASAMPPPPNMPPPDKPKPKKKGTKQVIVLQDDSDSSDDEPQQIIIRRSKKKPKDKKPQIIQYESSSSSESSSDDEPPQAPPQNKIVFRRPYR